MLTAIKHIIDDSFVFQPDNTFASLLSVQYSQRKTQRPDLSLPTVQSWYDMIR